MAFTYGNTGMWSLTGTIPTQTFLAYIAGATSVIKAGDILVMDSATTGNGYVKVACVTSSSANQTWDTDSLECGLVGVATHDVSTDGDPVTVALLTGFTGLTLPFDGADPDEDVIGVAPTTYYVLGRYESDDTLPSAWYCSSTTTKGVLKIVGHDPNDAIPAFGGEKLDYTALVDGDNVRVVVPPAYRFYNC